ncbi:MAG: hypothetical protein R3350_05530, partial [Saprospiraceae bacterium]|nr:hypothetical protein [Saprospiraceae bacterium]
MENIRWFFLIISSLCTPSLFAQVVWTEPALPSQDQAVTVFFDAAEGTAGLKDCACDVYVHT